MTSQTEADTEDNEVIVNHSSGKSIIQTNTEVKFLEPLCEVFTV